MCGRYPLLVVSYVGMQGGRRRLRLGRSADFRQLVLAGVLGGLAVVAAFGVAGRGVVQVGGAGVVGGGEVREGGGRTGMGTTVRALRPGGEAVRIPLSPSPQQSAETGRRWRAFVLEARLTLSEERTLKAALGDLHESWAAALAYFETMEETDETATGALGLLSAEHAEEMERLVRETTRARLERLLPQERLALLDRRFHPLSSLVAGAPALF